MILVTGGFGFIGAHTVLALLDRGESCVVVQRRAAQLPAAFATERVEVEQADVGDLAALRAIGARHDVTGIVHLAGSMPWPPGPDAPVPAARKAVDSLLNVVQVAQEWGVRRVGLASTIGVYLGFDSAGALGEDMPLPLTSMHVIPAFKKIGEVMGHHLAAATGIELVNYRIAAIWGPSGQSSSPFFAAPALVNAAALGTAPDFPQLGSDVYADDSIDMFYAKDCGRAIAALQLADRLNHSTYNVASGRATTNAEVVDAIRKVVPGFRIDLPVIGSGEQSYLDITRLLHDTDYLPAYNTERAVADYISWLRNGN
ncbi:NAD-dependent epimerase/dehydratase family protein [Kibdelosporangium phytohabitans]|uniref:UDP-glucose 4-epimerase n=1 Tax=Kibdelosporangium phytohabitans TaxID=860235 RepID=A0A0N7F5F9_9PSEU|nr:NAD(P)-dependent oxidoreductase [Kibdelosporangium phytohabitans]ALG14119.1 epimerase [Kibdelosporangium phytohabitans]